MENIHLRATFKERDAIRPFRIASEHCINRIDGYMGSIVPKEQVLWIHDGGSLNEHAESQLRDLRALLKELEADSAFAAKYAAWSNAPIEPEILSSHVADMIYFGNDKESRLLQLADVCCSTITRALRKDKTALPYYEILRTQVLNDGARPQYEDARKIVKPLRAMLAKRRT